MKALAIGLLLSAFAFTATADQLAYISKEEASRAAAFIQKHKKLILHCGCCSGDTKTRIKVKQINVKHTGYEDYWEVIIRYKVKGEKEIQETAIDLAYVHYKAKKLAKPVGSALNLEMDACVEPFDWKASSN